MILFSASNVCSVMAVKVRDVLWSVGMQQQKKNNWDHQLHTLQIVVIPFECLLPIIFFSEGNLIPFQHKLHS